MKLDVACAFARSAAEPDAPLLPWPTGFNGLPLPPLPIQPGDGWRTRFFATALLLDASELDRLHLFARHAQATASDILLPSEEGDWWTTRLVNLPEVVGAPTGWYRARLELLRLD